MSLPKTRPLSFYHRFASGYSRLFDPDFFLSHDPMGENHMAPSLKPPVNISRQGEAYELRLSIPGYRREDISVYVENGVLWVKGKAEDTEAGKVAYIVREHGTTQFERAFRLAAITDENRITARFRDGILCLRLPHNGAGPAQNAGARRVEVG